MIWYCRNWLIEIKKYHPDSHNLRLSSFSFGHWQISHILQIFHYLSLFKYLELYKNIASEWTVYNTNKSKWKHYKTLHCNTVSYYASEISRAVVWQIRRLVAPLGSFVLKLLRNKVTLESFDPFPSLVHLNWTYLKYHSRINAPSELVVFVWLCLFLSPCRFSLTFLMFLFCSYSLCMLPFVFSLWLRIH